jgi:hypothetical protein
MELGSLDALGGLGMRDDGDTTQGDLVGVHPVFIVT